MIKDVKQFKLELGLYRHYLKELKYHKQKVDDIYDAMVRLPSPSPKTATVSKKVYYTDAYGQRKFRIEKKTVPLPKTAPIEANRESMMIDRIEAKADAEIWQEYYQRRLDEINETLGTLSDDLRKLCMNVFVNNLWKKECEQRRLSKSALYRMIDKELMQELGVRYDKT